MRQQGVQSSRCTLASERDRHECLNWVQLPTEVAKSQFGKVHWQEGHLQLACPKQAVRVTRPCVACLAQAPLVVALQHTTVRVLDSVRARVVLARGRERVPQSSCRSFNECRHHANGHDCTTQIQNFGLQKDSPISLHW